MQKSTQYLAIITRFNACITLDYSSRVSPEQSLSYTVSDPHHIVDE